MSQSPNTDVELIHISYNQDGNPDSETILTKSNILDHPKFKKGDPVGAVSANTQTTFTDPLPTIKEAATRAASSIAKRAIGTARSI